MKFITVERIYGKRINPTIVPMIFPILKSLRNIP
jgi:hypothetical protein